MRVFFFLRTFRRQTENRQKDQEDAALPHDSSSFSFFFLFYRSKNISSSDTFCKWNSTALVVAVQSLKLVHLRLRNSLSPPANEDDDVAACNVSTLSLVAVVEGRRRDRGKLYEAFFPPLQGVLSSRASASSPTGARSASMVSADCCKKSYATRAPTT